MPRISPDMAYITILRHLQAGGMDTFDAEELLRAVALPQKKLYGVLYRYSDQDIDANPFLGSVYTTQGPAYYSAMHAIAGDAAANFEADEGEEWGALRDRAVAIIDATAHQPIDISAATGVIEDFNDLYAQGSYRNLTYINVMEL